MTSPTGPARASSSTAEDVRTGLQPETLARALLDNLYFVLAKRPEHASLNDWYLALAYTVRDRLLERYIHTAAAMGDANTPVKAVAYLSAEFLTGPHLGNAIVSLGIWPAAEAAVASTGQRLADLLDREEEPGLGNGGLGRLAACYMDSLATIDVPAIGYGIRYEFGIFDQAIENGWQVEITDKWLRHGNPWEIVRPELSFKVRFGGRTEARHDDTGRLHVHWIPDRFVKGVACDTPIPGYRGPTTNILRLWKAEATESFDFGAFNAGDYAGAVHQKVASETISKVLYPNDDSESGKRLRLEQQYFFVSCSLQDMLRMHALRGRTLDEFDDSWAVQLNDTHPSIAVAELMRLLLDEHALDWDRAWTITERACGYTNHTLLAEALEKWPLPLFSRLLPRHLEIIYEINRRFLDQVRARFPGDDGLARRVSIIDETGDKYIRMAHLASVGSHAINGVAALHSTLLQQTVLHDFYTVAPAKFRNVTNGVTPRRWMVLGNPKMAALISSRIGEGWVSRLEDELIRLEPFARDAAFRQEWAAIKLENKRTLAAIIKSRTDIVVDPESLFDIQVKRLHEYKRQHLNALHVITLYNAIRHATSGTPVTPRTVIFGGKAAPGYRMAKLMIRLITGVADVVNRDPAMAGRLAVVFLPDFNVKHGQPIYPAADLSEQISTAGKEASGTGNMKFALNGALTIGTLDGANVEIRDAVGPDNFFLFGLTAAEVVERRARGYDPRAIYDADPALREAVDMMAAGAFSGGDREVFRPIVDGLLGQDPYLLLADYASYIDCQGRAAKAYRDRERWAEMSVLNCARSGRFSSDRSIREYCRDIWHVSPLARKDGSK